MKYQLMKFIRLFLVQIKIKTSGSDEIPAEVFRNNISVSVLQYYF